MYPSFEKLLIASIVALGFVLSLWGGYAFIAGCKSNKDNLWSSKNRKPQTFNSKKLDIRYGVNSGQRNFKPRQFNTKPRNHLQKYSRFTRKK